MKLQISEPLLRITYWQPAKVVYSIVAYLRLEELSVYSCFIMAASSKKKMHANSKKYRDPLKVQLKIHVNLDH